MNKKVPLPFVFLLLCTFSLFFISCSSDPVTNNPVPSNSNFFTYTNVGTAPNITITITGLTFGPGDTWEQSTDPNKYNLVIPSTIEGYPVTSIGNIAFRADENPAYQSLVSIILPNTLISIGNYAFFKCTGLVSITIQNGVTSFGEGPFNLCTGLRSITIPSSVVSIIGTPLLACTGLTNIIVSSANPNYSSSNGVLYNKDKTRLICFPAGKSGTFSIPTSVTSIDDLAFYSCLGLSNVTIPYTVTSIGAFAFYNCSSLTSVIMNPTTPPTIITGSLPFEGCPSLTASDAIKVPAASLLAYENISSPWYAYVNIISAQP